MNKILKQYINAFLSLFGLRIVGLKGDINERDRLSILADKGQFKKQVFSIPVQFLKIDASSILDAVRKYDDKFQSFLEPANNSTGYTYQNDYYTSPDTEVLYSMIRLYKPARIIEVGSGNSTRIIRMAIEDGKLETELISIDPEPRIEIQQYTDKLYRTPVEDISDVGILCDLESGDILFIDSSHELRIGNDVVRLYCEVLPMLATGVIVHIHDIFLPWEYKEEWMLGNCWNWNEQYIVQVLLGNDLRYDVLWAGHYLQKTFPDFNQHFPNRKGRDAQSLWLRIK